MKYLSIAFLAGFLALLIGCAQGASTRTATLPGAPGGNASSAAPASGNNDASDQSPGNGGDAAPDSTEERVIDLEPIRIEVVGRDRVGDPELEAFDARALLDRGNAAMAERRYEDAIGQYEKLLAVFPDSQLAPAATYNIGLAYEGLDDLDSAIDMYRVLARDPGATREAIDAHLRIGGLLAEMQRWDDALQALREVLARTDLTHSDRIEGMARLGYVALEKKDYQTAESVLRESVAYYEKLTSGLESNYFVAMSYYYLAQIPHRQFRALRMRLPDEQLQKDFQAKSELVALAYDRYVDAVQIQNAYWATASGYQLSQIYKEFWDDIILAPVPTQLSAEAAEMYVQELHTEVRALLEKAVEGHSRNVELARAYRTSTVWSEASREQAAVVAEILARESSGELVTPTREGAPSSTGGEANGDAREYMPRRIEL